MKITKELKDVIQRQVERKRCEEADRIYAANKDAVAALNRQILSTDEFTNLRSALEAWENMIEKIIEDNPGICARYDTLCRSMSLESNWNFSNCINKKVVPLHALSGKTHDKFNELRDTIILKLSYEKDFDKAMAVLADYGITLEA